MKSLFKSEIAKKEILALYDQKLKELDLPYEYQTIETRYGKTNIIVAGDSSKPPLIVVHGSNGCAPIALESYPNLYKDFQVFAVDVLAQPNKSAETRLSMADNSYGLWLNDIIDKLQVQNVTLVGFSFGGLIILKTLLDDESKIKEVFLAAPAFIVNGNPLVALFKVFIPMRIYMATQKAPWLDTFLKTLFTEVDWFARKYLAQVFLNFNMDFTPVPVIKEANAESIRTPITLIAAKKDILFPGEKMLKRAKRIFPSLKKSVLLVDSKHVQNNTDNEKIEKLIRPD